MFLVVVDAYSRWLEVERMSSTTSGKTIETLQMLFARYRVPAELVNDNGPKLKSEEFEQFLKRNKFKHITSVPYHPATNGLADCVESFKNGMKLAYRNAPHSTTGEPPSQLFLGRRLYT